MESFIFVENNALKISPATKIIKAESHTRILAVEEALAEVRETGRSFIEKARRESEQILADAKKKAQEIINAAEAAHASEKQKGYEEGISAAKKDMAVEINTLALNTADFYRTVEKKMVDLVMDTVKKVIAQTDQDERVRGLVKSSLATMKSQKQITLKIAPIHLDLINARLGEIMADYPQIENIEVRADERIHPDNLILESDLGIVDASIEPQLAAIEEAFARCFAPQA